MTAAPGRTMQPAFSDAWRSCDPSNTNKIGRTEFPYISAPTVWNSIPDSLKHYANSREHFRKELKTYLFRKAYAPASEKYWRVNLNLYLLTYFKKSSVTNIICKWDEANENSLYRMKWGGFTVHPKADSTNISILCLNRLIRYTMPRNKKLNDERLWRRTNTK